MYTATVSTLDELILRIKDVVALNAESAPWWRGQAAHGEGWGLTAGVFREPYNEHDLVLAFMQRAFPRHDNCPRWEDRAGWLFLMQHYRVPTRLLDWTESPLVAAFFACLEEKHYDKEGVVWGMNPLRFNRIMSKGSKTVGLYPEDHPDLVLLMNGPFIRFHDLDKRKQPGESQLVEPQNPVAAVTVDTTKTKRSGFICPYANFGKAIIPRTALERVAAILSAQRNSRMSAQSSRFTIHGDRDPLNEIACLEPCLFKIAITSTAKRQMLAELGSLDIRLSSLFPDLDHLAEEVKRSCLVLSPPSVKEVGSDTPGGNSEDASAEPVECQQGASLTEPESKGGRS